MVFFHFIQLFNAILTDREEKLRQSMIGSKVIDKDNGSDEL